MNSMMDSTEFEFFKYFSEMLECSICSDTFVNPRKLPCGHTFCLKCLEMSAKHIPSNGNLSCPLCRNEIICKETISDLPENMLFLCLTDIKRRVDGHLSKYKSAYCSQQSCTKPASWHCTDCDLGICEACQTNLHGSHNVVLLEIFLKQSAESSVRDCLRVISTKLKSMTEAFTLSVSATEDAIIKKSEELKMIVDQHKNKLLSELHSAKQNQLENFETIHKEVKNLALQSKRTYQHSENKQKRGDDNAFPKECSRKTNAIFISETINLPCSLGQVDVLFQPRNLLQELLSLGSMSNILGELSFAEQNITRPNCETDEMTCKTCTLAAKRPGIVVGLSTLGDKLYVIHSLASNVDEYDSASFTLTASLPIKELFNPQDMASCRKSQCLYITDSYNNTVSCTKVRGKTDKWSVGDEPFGISVSDVTAHVFVTCMYSQRIYEFSSSGIVICCTFLQPEIEHPHHAVELSTGEIMLCHGFWSTDPVHRVSAIDRKTGRSYRHFGDGPGSERHQLNQPMHLAAFKNGFVVVADCANGRIHLVDSSLVGISCLADSSGQMKSPHRLCLDIPRGLLYVAENSLQNRLTVFRIKSFLP